MSVSGNIRASIALTNSLDNIDLSTPTERVSEAVSKAVSLTGVVYHDEIGLTGCQSYSIDIGDDSLDDVYGNSVGIQTMQGFYVSADATNTVDVTIGGTGVQSAFNALPALSAGEAVSLATNIDVSTDAKIYIQNGDGSSIIKIVIVGTE